MNKRKEGIMVYAIIAGIIGISIFMLAGNQIEQALSAFLFAGIIPGTSLQLPWYATLIAAPILLYLLYQALLSLLTKNLPRKTAISHATASKAKRKPLKTPLLLQKLHKNKRAKRIMVGLKKLIRKWHHTLEPQLQLLQQKLIALVRRLRGSTL